MRKILVVEDNVKINNILSNLLKAEGYDVLSAFNAFEALTMFEKNSIDCVITDLVLPIMSGEELIQSIRKSSNVHVLIISAKITIEEKLNGLRIGADDYLSKPFSEEEVVIKINNYFKKIDKKESTISLCNGMFVFEDMSNFLKVNNQPVELTSIEYLIVKLLLQNVNLVVSREDFVDYLYKNEKFVYERIVDSHIKNIRKKVEQHTKEEFIKTVYGLGYTIRGDAND